MKEEMNETLMNKIEEVKSHVLEEVYQAVEYLCRKKEDFAPDVNYVYAQSVTVFVYVRDILKQLDDYLEAELKNYTELERAEMSENRYDPFDYRKESIDTTPYFAFLARALCYYPSLEGIALDKNGWAAVAEVIDRMKTYWHDIDADFLIDLVENDKKARFSFNEDKTKIRANAY